MGVQGPELRPQHGAYHHCGTRERIGPGRGQQDRRARPQCRAGGGQAGRRIRAGHHDHRRGGENLAATSSAITSAVPVSTDVAEPGERVRGASGTGGAGSCGAAPVQDVVPTATAATSASTAPAVRGITARPLPIRQLSTRHPGSTSASHQSSAALPRGEGRRWLWTRRPGLSILTIPGDLLAFRDPARSRSGGGRPWGRPVCHSPGCGGLR